MNRRHVNALLVVCPILSLTLAGCGASNAATPTPGQSVAEGYRTLCNGSVAALVAAVDAEDPAVADGSLRAVWVSDWIDAHVTNGEVLSAFREIAQRPSDRSAALSERARAAGVTECAFANEFWTSSPAPDEPPAVSAPTAELPGTLNADAIREVVQRGRNQVRFCFESALAETPGLSGRVELAFVIALDGMVASAEVSAANDALRECVVSRVRGWTFPAPEGGAVGVRYPFVFAP